MYEEEDTVLSVYVLLHVCLLCISVFSFSTYCLFLICSLLCHFVLLCIWLCSHSSACLSSPITPTSYQLVSSQVLSSSGSVCRITLFRLLWCPVLFLLARQPVELLTRCRFVTFCCHVSFLFYLNKLFYLNLLKLAACLQGSKTRGLWQKRVCFKMVHILTLIRREEQIFWSAKRLLVDLQSKIKRHF